MTCKPYFRLEVTISDKHKHNDVSKMKMFAMLKRYGPLEVPLDFARARLTKGYDVTIQRYRNSHAEIEHSKMYIFRCIWIQIFV